MSFEQRTPSVLIDDFSGELAQVFVLSSITALNRSLFTRWGVLLEESTSYAPHLGMSGVLSF